MVGRAHLNELAERLLSAEGVMARWQTFQAGLGEIGLDQVNYGIIDTSLVERMDAPVRFLSTMLPEWLAYYADRRLDLSDPHVAFVREGNLQPYRWGESVLAWIENENARQTVALTVEAGLRSQISVTMADPLGSTVPVGGMTLGSSQSETDYFRSVAGQEFQLIALAQLFHMLSIGEIRRTHHGARRLTARERDCLQWVAAGLRSEQIAQRLGLARVTVDFHLRNTRRKLGAKTLPEAVARGVLFQEIRFA